MKSKVIETMKQLDEIAKKDYKIFEIALILGLRSTIDEVELLEEDTIIKVADLIDETDSLLDLDRDDIDYLLEDDEDDE